ncbi:MULTISPECIES: low molecular weight protein-tyrosine-phosphatase [Acinetobacter]|uniref:low molecular weight protein-tyrosine-phosphatase n=1 Tax=Acinetobacter TaxID=469 RepID=UPI001FB24279|nr:MULTISPECIES: low molecular weight protein-tyrosine-phosphatase [Acinetobacter]MCJ0927402.1 low molecular weight phosphotyrosine protein phosphatase [Acinetobacter lwoffii]MCO8081101.1 low molecular weight phosphotyrosine protein phosphatase [Acinetobacter lwoffii]
MSSRTPYKVLCVCLGNICRSPTAEVVLRHYCDEQQLNIVVGSAGTSNYHPGKAPDLRSQKHALKRGYDLSALRARQLIPHDFIDYDLILAMDLENLSNIQNIQRLAETQFGHVRARVALMSEHDQTYPKQALPDPYYGEADGFERVLDQCESSSQAWIEIFKQNLHKV